MAQEVSLKDSLSFYDAFITYVPLRTEVPFGTFFSAGNDKAVYEIAPRASLDPFAEAEKAIAIVGNKRACVLMPGRRFDTTGTRFGQGGGWYDRFLSRVPKEWMRVGFCYARQFSPEPLKREEWDQVMDIVCVVDEKSNALVAYETKGRGLATLRI